MSKKKIPEFEDLEQMAKFWGSESSADYWDDMDKSEVKFQRPVFKTMSLKMDPNMLSKLKILAKRKGLSYSAYIRLLLSEGIENELRSL